MISFFVTALDPVSKVPKQKKRRFKTQGQTPRREAIGVKIEGVPFVTVDWSRIEPTVHKGETGQALWRPFERGNIRVRMVEYSPGYRADHWCARGHVLLVMEGRLTTELKDGRVFELLPGTSYHAEDDSQNPHRSWTDEGARLFIVD